MGKDGWRDEGGEEEEAVGCHVQPAAAGAHGNKMEITAGFSLSETTLVSSRLVSSRLVSSRLVSSSGLKFTLVEHSGEQWSLARCPSHL